MKQLEIDNKNVIIAKFLGWFQQEGQPETWFIKGDCSIGVVYATYKNYPHRDLPFHRDWTWLMKAFNKIEDLGYYTEISNVGVHWDDDSKSHHICAIYKDTRNRFPEITRKFGDEKIETVWKAVVSFSEKYLNGEA